MKQDLDTKDIADAGDHALIQEDFPDFPVSLRVQEAKEPHFGEIGPQWVGSRVSPSGIPLKVGLGKELDNRR